MVSKTSEFTFTACLFLKHHFITHENSLTRRFVNRTVQLFSHHSLYSLTSSHYTCTANNKHDYPTDMFVIWFSAQLKLFRSVSVEIQTLNAVSIFFQQPHNKHEQTFIFTLATTTPPSSQFFSSHFFCSQYFMNEPDNKPANVKREKKSLWKRKNCNGNSRLVLRLIC